jgi:hypothetical protein
VVVNWWVPPLTAQRVFWNLARLPGLLSDNDSAFPTGVQALGIGALAIALALVVVGALVRGDRALRLIACCALAPYVAGVAGSLVLGRNVFIARYLLVAEVFLPIAVVGFVFARARRRVATLLMVPIAIAVIVALVGQLPMLAPQPDVPAAAEWIAQRRRHHDLVIVQQFYYWSFKLQSSDYDPNLRNYMTVSSRPGSGPLEDAIYGPALFASVHGHVFVVDSEAARTATPATFHPLAHEGFPVAMPGDRRHWIDVTEYDVP